MRHGARWVRWTGRVPGVRAVVTARDVQAAGLGPIMPLVVLKGSNGQNMHCSGMPLLAQDVVRHVGEPVALVVADTLEQAMNGAEAVTIDYEPLPGVTDFSMCWAFQEACSKPFGWTEGLNRVYITQGEDFLYQDPYKNCTFLEAF